MKKVIIRSIGVLLIVVGAMKAYLCLRVVVVLVPIAVENGLEALGRSASVLNIVMAGIGLTKVTAGMGLIWMKRWAKWVTVMAVALHILFLAFLGIPLWIKMLNSAFEWPDELPFWRIPATIGINLLLVIALFMLWKDDLQQ